MLALARLTYLAGTGGSSQPLPGPLLLTVQSGSLAVHLADIARLEHAPDPTVSVRGDILLQAGDGLVLPLGSTPTVRSAGPMPAVALAAGVFPALSAPGATGRTRAARWDGAWLPGATVEAMVGGWAVHLPRAPVTLALQRVSLQPGSSALPLAAVAALAVEAGTLTLTDIHGLVWHQSPTAPDTLLRPDVAATLLPGEGVLLPGAEASATLRNDGSGPLLALVVTVGPAAAQGTSR
jgi:hypothetical protein